MFGLGSSSDDVDYIKADSSTGLKQNKDNYAYLTNSNTFDKIIFTQSIRYDDYDNFDSKATGKLGIKYEINKDLFITSNVGLAYTVPSIVQELNPWGAMNNELNPENTKSSDISIGYKDFKVTYFHNRVTDLIEWYDPSTPVDYSDDYYKNLNGESILKGYEFEYAKNISDDLHISLNYTKLSAKDKDGKVLTRRAESQIDFSSIYYISDNLDLGFNAQYIGERYNDADKQGAQTGKYTVANLVTNYELNNYLSFYAKVDNLNDKYYQVVDGYATAGRSFFLGLNANY